MTRNKRVKFSKKRSKKSVFCRDYGTSLGSFECFLFLIFFLPFLYQKIQKIHFLKSQNFFRLQTSIAVKRTGQCVLTWVSLETLLNVLLKKIWQKFPLLALLLEDRLVFWPAQQVVICPTGPAGDSVQKVCIFSQKQNSSLFCWNYLKINCGTALGVHWFLSIFDFV